MMDHVRYFPRKRDHETELECDKQNQDTQGPKLIHPKPLINPCLESRERKELHRELMWNQRIGHQVLNTKSELQRKLQERRQHENKVKFEAAAAQSTPLPEFIQVHKRITSGNPSGD